MKNKPAKEPETDDELTDALKALGVEVIDNGGSFTATTRKGSRTRLDAEDFSNALFEAWNLHKP